jgi:hypothetical protein
MKFVVLEDTEVFKQCSEKSEFFVTAVLVTETLAGISRTVWMLSTLWSLEALSCWCTNLETGLSVFGSRLYNNSAKTAVGTGITLAGIFKLEECVVAGEYGS